MVHAQLAHEEVGSGEHTGSASVSSGRDIRNRLPLAQLPMMPQVLVRLLDLCHRDDANFGDLAAVIRRDAGMSARVISVAASAMHHGRTRPASLDQCLTLLGMSAIKMLVINDSILQVFRRFTRDRDFDLRRFWGHSLRSALIARELAKALDYANVEEAYLGGLMHDVGQLAMLAADADAYAPLFLKHDDHEELCRHEQKVFNLTHAEVGAWLIEKWELDSLLSDGVLFHHDPIERIKGSHILIRIVFLSNSLSVLCGQEPGEVEKTLISACGAGEIDVSGLLRKIELEVVELATQLGIELAADHSPSAATEEDTAGVGSDINELAVKVRDVLLVDRVLGQGANTQATGEHENAGDAAVDPIDTVLQTIAQAARLLFGVNPPLCFLPDRKQSEHFIGRPIGSRWRKAALLDFVRGQSNAMVARAIDQGAVLYIPGERAPSVLDEQLQRMIGGAGLLLVPLRSQQRCQGVLVAGFVSEMQALAIRKRISCLDYFALTAARLLGAVRDPAVGSSDQGNMISSSNAVKPVSDGNMSDRMRRVMHEISNPLSIIQNYLAALEMKYAQHNIGTQELGIVSEEITRVSKILQDALQPQSESRPVVRAVQLNSVIEDLVELCRSSSFVSSSVDIQTRLFPGVPDLPTDKDRLKQLLLNLLKNAIEAVAGKGGVVRVGTAPWGDGVTRTHIEIRIEDSGPGIPAEVLAQLYHPVSSAKGGEHRGVGLAIVGQLVRDLHGLINCRSNERGTSFQLLLPLEHQ